jgi:hypothetical protein
MANIFRKVKDVMSGRLNDPNDTAHYDDGGKWMTDRTCVAVPGLTCL